jgi:hypothetical protein
MLTYALHTLTYADVCWLEMEIGVRPTVTHLEVLSLLALWHFTGTKVQLLTQLADLEMLALHARHLACFC